MIKNQNAISCPDCNSTDVCSQEVAWSKGTNTVSGTSVGVSLDGDLGVSSHSLQSSSNFALSVAPPAKRPTFLTGALSLSFLLVGGGALVLGLLSLTSDSRWTRESASFQIWFGVVLLLLLIPSAIIWASAKAYNDGDWKLAYAQWRKWWVCLRCGKKFMRSA